MQKLRADPVRSSEQEDSITHILKPEHNHQQARQAQAKATVRRAAKTEEIDVELDRLQVQAFFERLF